MARKKKRTQKGDDKDKNEEDVVKVPKTMVFKRGKVGFNVQHLVNNMRKVMSPYTAVNLKENKKNQLKDFVSVAPQLGVSHFITFNQTSFGVNMRVMRTPNGPTLTFRVEGYSLMKDVALQQKRPHSPGSEFEAPPLLVLNNFSGEETHKQLMVAMFQHMLPSIDVKSVKLAECRRLLLLHLDSDTGELLLRHYYVKASPVGLTKSVKRIIKGKTPNLHDREDIADYVFNPGNLSDSEAEDTAENRITLSQRLPGRGNRSSQKSAVRLKEIGPRIRLKLLKIEEEMNEGLVLYHHGEKRTPEELQEMKERKFTEKKLREKRKKIQNANVEAKQRKLADKVALRQAKRQKRLDGGYDNDNGSDGDGDKDESGDDNKDEEDYDADVAYGIGNPTHQGYGEQDDAKYYEEEVGQKPDADLFRQLKKSSNRRTNTKSKTSAKGEGGDGKGKKGSKGFWDRTKGKAKGT